MAKVFKVLAIVAAFLLASCSSAAVQVISDGAESGSMEAAVVETTKVEVKTTTSQPKVETTTRMIEEIPVAVEVVESKPMEVIEVKPEEAIDNKPVEPSKPIESIDSRPVEVTTSEEIAPVEATFQAPSDKRKVLYINQQQNGKLNVQLELKDVSVFIVPKHKDPQTSLLNLLFKNAQKPTNSVEDKKPFNGDYSKFTTPVALSDESDRINPHIESRTPYRVDISSTLGRTGPDWVDIVTIPPTNWLETKQGNFFEQYQHPKTMPSPLAQSSRQMFKRSIDNRVHEMDFNTQEQPESEITDDGDYEEANFVNDGTEEFVLLGAVENCGPGRRRNSYQICVSVD